MFDFSYPHARATPAPHTATTVAGGGHWSVTMAECMQKIAYLKNQSNIGILHRLDSIPYHGLKYMSSVENVVAWLPSLHARDRCGILHLLSW